VVQSLEKRGQLQIWPRPPIPFMTSLMRIVGQEVHAAIWGDAPVEGVLARAENRLQPAPEDLPHLFTPFYRGRNGRGTAGHGIGLGLAQRIIRLHQGEIHVESRPGEGSTFTVRLAG
jgi:light-regulated signal transduction histidine kinase (bacteriophytochrome)